MEELRVAVVTGAGSGIGRAVSVALHREGYVVCLVGRRVDNLLETKDLLEEEAPSLVVPADVSDPDSVHDCFRTVLEFSERVDLLVNNAGTNAPSVALEELTPAQWQEVIGTNLSGAFYCTQEAFRAMKRQDPKGGRIINNGSISAHAPRPNSAPYTASKHALTGLTRSTSLDGRAYDIACGQIDVGNAATEFTDRMAEGVLQPYGEIVPEPRMDVDIVARAVVYMASLPLDANVLFMTVMANAMPYVGRG